MMNIGVKPTLELEKESIEVNLFNWNKNLYGKEIKVSVINYVRKKKNLIH
jgi:riboflavin kinase/FMN adenylyltransferase